MCITTCASSFTTTTLNYSLCFSQRGLPSICRMESLFISHYIRSRGIRTTSSLFLWSFCLLLMWCLLSGVVVNRVTTTSLLGSGRIFERVFLFLPLVVSMLLPSPRKAQSFSFNTEVLLVDGVESTLFQM